MDRNWSQGSFPSSFSPERGPNMMGGPPPRDGPRPDMGPPNEGRMGFGGPGPGPGNWGGPDGPGPRPGDGPPMSGRGMMLDGGMMMDGPLGNPPGGMMGRGMPNRMLGGMSNGGRGPGFMDGPDRGMDDSNGPDTDGIENMRGGGLPGPRGPPPNLPGPPGSGPRNPPGGPGPPPGGPGPPPGGPMGGMRGARGAGFPGPSMGMMGPDMMGMMGSSMLGHMGPMGGMPGDHGGPGLDFGFGGFAGPDGMEEGAGRGRGGRRPGRFIGRGGGRTSGRSQPLVTGPSRGDANDYCQHFVDTGQRPQNFLRDSQLNDRYEEYPKLRELIDRKDDLAEARATPPYYMKADLSELKLSVETFGTKFDVVLIDPPWSEYVRRAPGAGPDTSWTWQDIRALEIENITAAPSFCFLWCGSAEGLDAGRHCLQKWGFRRCEDICWIKANTERGRRTLHQDAHNTLQHTKEHCLMGIKGTVRRSQDAHVIHANIDTDIIVTEEPKYGSDRKPEEMYYVIEHFALGRRRLELFGEEHNVRPGWVTVGLSLSTSNFSPQAYASHFLLPDGTPYIGGPQRPPPGAPHLLGTTEDIENLRPRSPPMGQR